MLCQHLVWYFYSDAEATDDIAPIIDKVEAEQLPILVLLVLKLLPRLSAKGGDVRDIRQDYRRLFSWLSETVNKGIIMQKLPLLTQMEDEIRHDPDILCRLHLISTANQILNSFGALSTRERISISNKELLENQFDPEVGGIWTENEFSTVFWQFESIANGYHLYRYQADSSRKSLVFTKYFMKFFHLGNEIMALVIHPPPSAILSLASRCLIIYLPISTAIFKLVVKAIRMLSLPSAHNRLMGNGSPLNN